MRKVKKALKYAQVTGVLVMFYGALLPLSCLFAVIFGALCLTSPVKIMRTFNEHIGFTTALKDFKEVYKEIK